MIEVCVWCFRVVCLNMFCPKSHIFKTLCVKLTWYSLVLFTPMLCFIFLSICVENISCLCTERLCGLRCLGLLLIHFFSFCLWIHFAFFFLWDWISVCGSDWPGSHCIVQTCLELGLLLPWSAGIEGRHYYAQPVYFVFNIRQSNFVIHSLTIVFHFLNTILKKNLKYG